MKEKIAENLYHISAAARYGADFPKWETLKLDQQDFFRKKADTLVLALLEEEIKKVENPYPKAKLASAEYYEGEGFHRACQAILKIVEI